MGNNPDTELFKIAKESYVVDSTDYDAMKKLIVDKKIDGVYMGAAEPVISVACQYINDFGLPCYCTKEQWSLLQNKHLFKQLCAENGLPVVELFTFKDGNICLDDEAFPVITKPTDSCGSFGFSICRNNEELVSGYNKAKENSGSGGVVVEKYVNNKGIVVFYSISQGIVSFSGMNDKFPVKFPNSDVFVGGLYEYKSRYALEFRNKYEEKIKKMVSELNP